MNRRLFLRYMCLSYGFTILSISKASDARYVIDPNECINCSLCEPECPVNAISFDECTDKINPYICNECIGYYDSPACIPVCPVDAIFKTKDWLQVFNSHKSCVTDSNKHTKDNKLTIDERIVRVIVEQLGVKSESLSARDSFSVMHGADELDMVELVMAFEEEFKIQLPADKAVKLDKVGDMVSFIKSIVVKKEMLN